MQNKIFPLFTSILILFLCVERGKADLLPIDVEVGVAAVYAPDFPDGREIDTSIPVDQYLQHLLAASLEPFTPKGALMGSAYGFVGYEFWDFPTLSATIEGLGMVRIDNLDDDLGRLDNAYGGGTKLSFGILGTGAYVRAGYGKFKYALRVTVPPATADPAAANETRTVKKSESGLYIGAGLKFGLLTLGYYYLPSIESSAHTLSLGLQF